MNVLIVDDQSIVTQSIESSVSWEKLLISGVYTANSAREAKKILGEEQIDILLSDIEMPGESGLELLSWVRQKKLPLECIFLTSHADFSYAQEAIHLGGLDYILQPARTSDIEAAVQRASQRIVRNTRLKTLERNAGIVDRHRTDIMAGYIDHTLRSADYKITAEMMSAVFPDSKGNSIYSCFGFCLLNWKCDPKEWPEDLLRFTLGNVIGELFSGEGIDGAMLVQLNHDLYAGFICSGADFTEERYTDKLETFLQFLESYAKFDIAIEQENQCSVYDISQAVRRMEHEFRQNLSVTPGIRRGSRKSQSPDSAIEYDLHTGKWKEWMEENSRMVRSDIRNAIAGIQKERGLTVEDTGYIWAAYTRNFFSVLEEHSVDPISVLQPEYTVKSFVEASSSLDAMKSATDRAEKILSDLKAQQEPGSEDFLVTAQRYISDNLHRSFSRADVAEAVCMNEVYFSRVFRQRTGQTFQQYVQNERMNYAKELLKNTQLPVSMVASRVGFDNFSYFSKVFRKETGVTPQEFRQNAQM